MKIKTNKAKFQRLIETHILKSKLHEQINLNNNLLETNVAQIVYKFKRVLNLIFKFHQHDKKILFLGTPYYLNKDLKKGNHVGVDSKYHQRKLNLSATAQKSKFVANNSAFDFPLMKGKPHLVVAFYNSDESKYDYIVKESVKNKIPVIKFFSSTTQKRSNDNLPFVVSNIVNYSFYKSNFNTFFSVINAMLKRKTKKIIAKKTKNDSKFKSYKKKKTR